MLELPRKYGHVAIFKKKVSRLAGRDITTPTRGDTKIPYRSCAMYIVFTFTGITLKRTAQYFKCDRSNVGYAVDSYRGYLEAGDEKAIRSYNKLLDVWIESCRTFLMSYKQN